MAARPTTRRPTSATVAATRPGASTGSPVRDFGASSAPFKIDWDVRPVYDFLFSLSDDAGKTDDLPAADREWLKTAHASMPKGVEDEIAALFESEIAIHVASYLVVRPDLRTVDQFLEARPSEGAPPKFRTEARVAYDEQNLYVFVRSFDPHPDSIASHLARRDEENPSDRITLMLGVKDGIVDRVGFTGRGCAISQASASLLTDEIKGKPLVDVQAFGADDLLDLLGIDISPARLKCAMLSHDTLRGALTQLDAADGAASTSGAGA